MDANAKILLPPVHMEQHVGAFYLKGTHARVINLSENVRDNRQRFLNFVVEHELCVCNTWFEKPVEEIITYKAIATNIETHPLESPYFEQVDFVLIAHRWRNAC